MTDRDGVPPSGGTPERSPAAPAPRDEAPGLPPAPAEPTLRADPATRHYDVPIDTGELRSLPTAQLLVVRRPAFGDEASAQVEEESQQRRMYSWVAAVLGVLGAAASLFVGWMLPVPLAAIIFGVLGLRREEEGRTLAFVGIGAGIAGLVFSAVWIGYYAIVFGALPR